MRRIGIRVKKADRDRFGFAGDDAGDDLVDVVRLERHMNCTGRGAPLANLEGHRVVHRRHRRREQQVVACFADPHRTTESQQIPEPLRDDERGSRACPFEQHVRGERGAVHEPLDDAACQTRGRERDLDAAPDTLARVGRGGDDLRRVNHTRAVDEHHIGERPAHVDPDRDLHRVPRSCTVAGESTTPASSSTTPYESRAAARDTRRSRTSRATASGSRANGSPSPPPPEVPM